jgi:hypothetical protein
MQNAPLIQLETVEPWTSLWKLSLPLQRLPVGEPRDARHRSPRITPAQSYIHHGHRLALHPNSADQLNFPFAFIVLMTLGSGLLATACGLIAANLWLSLTGLVLTSTGGLWYGWSLSDDSHLQVGQKI